MKSLPNHLTISRFWMTAVMMVCMTLDFPYARIAALIIFIIASITDALRRPRWSCRRSARRA